MVFFIEAEKQPEAFVVCGSVQSVALHLVSFKDMQMLRHTKTLGIIQVDEAVWRHLSAEEKADIGRICDEKLAAYYRRLA